VAEALRIRTPSGIPGDHAAHRRLLHHHRPRPRRPARLSRQGHLDHRRTHRGPRLHRPELLNRRSCPRRETPMRTGRRIRRPFTHGGRSPDDTASLCWRGLRSTVGDRPIRVLLAEDQDLVRAGFPLLLDVADDPQVVGQACDGSQAVSQALTHRPDVVLMDIACRSSTASPPPASSPPPPGWTGADPDPEHLRHRVLHRQCRPRRRELGSYVATHNTRRGASEHLADSPIANAKSSPSSRDPHPSGFHCGGSSPAGLGVTERQICDCGVTGPRPPARCL
jgi:hypothetical protein